MPRGRPRSARRGCSSSSAARRATSARCSAARPTAEGSAEAEALEVRPRPLRDRQRLVEVARIQILLDDAEALVADLVERVAYGLEVDDPLLRLDEHVHRDRGRERD